MKAYLTSLSLLFFYLFFFKYMSLSFSFSSGVAFHQSLNFLSFFSSVTFHWPLIFLSFFFPGVTFQPLISLSFFLSFFLDTSSNHFLFSGFSRGQSMNRIVTWFLSFFWCPFNLPIWAGLGKTVYSLHLIHICLLWDLLANWLVWFFLFADSTFPLPCITWVSWPISIQPSNRSLVARGCLLVNTPILGKLDRQSVSTHPWPKFNSSGFSFSSAGLRRKQK